MDAGTMAFWCGWRNWYHLKTNVGGARWSVSLCARRGWKVEHKGCFFVNYAATFIKDVAGNKTRSREWIDTGRVNYGPGIVGPVRRTWMDGVPLSPLSISARINAPAERQKLALFASSEPRFRLFATSPASSQRIFQGRPRRVSYRAWLMPKHPSNFAPLPYKNRINFPAEIPPDTTHTRKYLPASSPLDAPLFSLHAPENLPPINLIKHCTWKITWHALINKAAVCSRMDAIFLMSTNLRRRMDARSMFSKLLQNT